MHNTSLVTVIIPTYNRAAKVAGAIESALRQTYTNIQLIVADDGSTDNTAAVVKNYPGVEYLQLTHGGQGWARSHGLKIAKGKYIASLDSDDIWNDNFLEECVGMIERGKLDFVFANWMQELRNGDMVERFAICEDVKSFLEECPDECIPLNSHQLRKIYLTGCPSPSSSLLVRRSSMPEQWDSHFRITDDLSMLMDMIFRRNCRAAFTRQILWSKYLDGKNVYDGKACIDLTNDFWVHDKERLLSRVKPYLSGQEIQEFHHHYVLQLVNLSYWHLLIHKQFFTSFRLFCKALSVNSVEVFSVIMSKISKRKAVLGFSFSSYRRKAVHKISLLDIQYKDGAKDYNKKLL